MNKPKLNEPDVEVTTTTFNSTTGESITINETIPSQQFKDIFVTGMKVEDQQSIVDFKQNHGELNLREYGHIKFEPDVITYNGKIYVAIDSLNPTFEEVKKEWKEKGWKIDEDEYFKTITFIKGDRGIEFNIEEKYYFTFQPTPEHNSFNIDIEFHALICKTLKALEVIHEKED